MAATWRDGEPGEERRMGNLTAPRTGTVDRREEVAEVERLFTDASPDDPVRLVTLTGVGGVGKTRVALDAAAALQPRFHDGAWLVELSPLRERGDLLAHVIAEALPLADQTSRPMTEVLAEYLADRELLLVLDTCEHLVHDCARLAQSLLKAAPGLRILATSRRVLNADGERVLAVEPLPVPDGDDARAGTANAVVLLTMRAKEAVPGFTVTDAERAELVRLCRRLDGLPLAIELAAARLRDLPVRDLTDRLDDRFAVLGDTDSMVTDADPPWHRALRTAIGWSHQLCTPAERLLWARLSVFAGSFDAEAARQVCADEHLPAQQIPAVLGALTEKSILIWQPTGGGERYRMLDTIREYGAHWLRAVGEDDTLRSRHRDHYQALAHRAEAVWMGPQQTAWYERMVTEHANLRAALEFCLAEQDGHRALELGGTLWFYWTSCGYAKEGLHYLDRALAQDPVPGLHQAKALWACGHVAIILGDAEAGLRLAAAFREAVAKETDEGAGFVAAFLEGISFALRGQLAQAAEALDKAPRTRPGTGPYDPAWFSVKATRGFVHVYLGEFADAVAVGSDVCAEGTRRGETWARAWGDYVLALAALGLGRAEEAAAHARTALDGKRRFRNGVGIAMAVDVLACATVAAGRAEQAARLLGVADQTWRALGRPQMGTPSLVASRQACEARARRLIGDHAYETAFRVGYDTDLDTGITYALSTPDATPPQAPV